MADSTGRRKQKNPHPRSSRSAREGQVARSRDCRWPSASLAADAVLVLVRAGRLVERPARRAVATALDARRPTAHARSQPGRPHAAGGRGGTRSWRCSSARSRSPRPSPASRRAAQGGWTSRRRRWSSTWAKLNPANGLKRLAPSQARLDAREDAHRVHACSDALGYDFVKRSGCIDAPRLMPACRRPMRRAPRWMAICAAAVADRLRAAGRSAAADYVLQRWRLMTSLKMTKQEVRDEAQLERRQPGNQGARAQGAARDVARRMLATSRSATVVITNPTHFAVALEYRREKMPAPVVVAKGQDHLAQRIRDDRARRTACRSSKTSPLARALHARPRSATRFPAELFGAVAEVLGVSRCASSS